MLLWDANIALMHTCWSYGAMTLMYMQQEGSSAIHAVPLVHKEACGTWLAASFDLQSASWLSAACLPAKGISNCSLSLSMLVQSTCKVLSALTLSARDISAHCRAFTHPALEHNHAHHIRGFFALLTYRTSLLCYTGTA